MKVLVRYDLFPQRLTPKLNPPSSMDISSTPRNRKERRAQARQKDSNNIPLTQPSRSPPTGKTLLQIASEREQHIFSLEPHTTNNTNNTTSLSPSASQPIKTPYLDILLHTTTLLLLNYTFTFLTTYQYSSTPPSPLKVFLSSTLFSPTPLLLFLLVAILHPRAAHPATQALFAAVGIAVGGWLVHITNKEGYLAEMRRAPPLGTVWVWCVAEMEWKVGVGCVGVVGVWGWWKGYGLF